MTELTSELAPDRLTADRAAALIPSWELVLRAERKSPQTIKVYGDGLRRYLLWCAEQGAGPMDRTSLNQWVAGLLDQGAAAGTARMRQLAVRRFTAWLIVEGRLPADPFQGMRAPKVDQPVMLHVGAGPARHGHQPGFGAAFGEPAVGGRVSRLVGWNPWMPARWERLRRARLNPS